MPRKILKTKPLKARKPRAPPKISRKTIPFLQRMQIVEDKKLGLRDRKIGNRLSINYQTVNIVFRKVINRSYKLGLPNNNPRCYKDNTSTKRRKRVITKDYKDELVYYITLIRENRKKIATEYINELNLYISVSKFEQIIYDRGYLRGIAGWKLYLSNNHKRTRKGWCQQYRYFDQKNGFASSDETPLRTAKQNGGNRQRKPGEELHLNIKNTTDQLYNKSIGQINGIIAQGYKSLLTFIQTETKEGKKAAVKHLREENERFLP